MFYLPENLGSIEQLEALESVSHLIVTENKSLNVYQNRTFDFIPKTEKEYRYWITENKNQMANEIHKL